MEHFELMSMTRLTEQPCNVIVIVVMMMMTMTRLKAHCNSVSLIRLIEFIRPDPIPSMSLFGIKMLQRFT